MKCPSCSSVALQPASRQEVAAQGGISSSHQCSFHSASAGRHGSCTNGPLVLHGTPRPPFPSRCRAADGGPHGASGGRDGPGLSVSLGREPQHGVLDQSPGQGPGGGLPPGVRRGLLSPVPREDRVPEDGADGRKRLHEERHPPGHRGLPLLGPDLPPGPLDQDPPGGGSRRASRRRQRGAAPPGGGDRDGQGADGRAQRQHDRQLQPRAQRHRLPGDPGADAPGGPPLGHHRGLQEGGGRPGGRGLQRARPGQLRRQPGRQPPPDGRGAGRRRLLPLHLQHGRRDSNHHRAAHRAPPRWLRPLRLHDVYLHRGWSCWASPPHRHLHPGSEAQEEEPEGGVPGEAAPLSETAEPL